MLIHTLIRVLIFIVFALPVGISIAFGVLKQWSILLGYVHVPEDTENTMLLLKQALEQTPWLIIFLTPIVVFGIGIWLLQYLSKNKSFNVLSFEKSMPDSAVEIRRLNGKIAGLQQQLKQYPSKTKSSTFLELKYDKGRFLWLSDENIYDYEVFYSPKNSNALQRLERPDVRNSEEGLIHFPFEDALDVELPTKFFLAVKFNLPIEQLSTGNHRYKRRLEDGSVDSQLEHMVMNYLPTFSTDDTAFLNFEVEHEGHYKFVFQKLR